MKSQLISVVSFILLILPWPQTTLRLLATITYLIVLSFLLGKKFSPTKEWIFRFMLGLTLLLSVIMISCTAFFYLAQLNYLALITAAAIPICLLFIPYRREVSPSTESWHWSAPVIPLIHAGLGGLVIWQLHTHATAEPIPSPWLLLPPSIWVLYAVTACASVLIATRQRIPAWIKMISISWQLFISGALVVFMYPLGFGFDPFIHQATEQIISTTGTISPKPFYYIGQYSLVTWLHFWSQLPIRLIDSWLLPLLAALLLPSVIYYSFRCNFRSEPRALALLPLTFLLLPYPFLIQTTPQGLSLLWSLLIIILSFFYIHKEQLPATLLIIISLAALTLHPLSGIPLLLYTVMLIVYHRSWEAKKIIRWIRLSLYGVLTLIAALALPLVFALQSRLSQLNPSKISIEEASTSSLWQWPVYYRFIRWDDLIYLWESNSNLILVVLALIGFWYVVSHRRAHYFVHYLITYVVLICNYVLLSIFVHFDFLLPYERQSYPDRILTLSYFFLWPFVFITLYTLTKRLLKAPLLIQSILMIIISLTMTVSWYLSYPRFDYYHQNKGYNTSSHDLAAVAWIQNNAGSKPHIVLANQSVSAAAIQTVGFQPYYKGHYFYPIPTGDPLYQSYLDAVYNRKAVSSILQDVKALTGVSSIYIVVNDYWSGFEDTIQRLKKSADTTTVINGGRIYIFTFAAR